MQIDFRIELTRGIPSYYGDFMAIQGKKKYQVYLTPEHAENVRSYLDTRSGSGGFSQFLDEYVVMTSGLLDDSGLSRNGRITYGKVLKMVVNWIKKSPDPL